MNEKDRLETIIYLENQMNDGYLDIRNHSGDENAFDIIEEALELYKEKHNVE